MRKAQVWPSNPPLNPRKHKTRNIKFEALDTKHLLVGVGRRYADASLVDFSWSRAGEPAGLEGAASMNQIQAGIKVVSHSLPVDFVQDGHHGGLKDGWGMSLGASTSGTCFRSARYGKRIHR